MSSTDTSNGTPISGAVALVTGGNRGFGRALVDELLERGAAKVYATSRSAQPQRDDDRIVPLILDVTDDTSVAAAAQTATDVSILVNNAGIQLTTPVLEAPLSDIRAELETNLFGIIRVARAFAPVLAGQPRSSMVNVLSGLSWLSFGRGYEISKSAAMVGDQRAPPRAPRPGHDRDRAARRLHGHRHDSQLDVPKADPRDIARQTADAIIAGDFEILADDLTRTVKSQLSDDVTALYAQLAAA